MLIQYELMMCFRDFAFSLKELYGVLTEVLQILQVDVDLSIISYYLSLCHPSSSPWDMQQNIATWISLNSSDLFPFSTSTPVTKMSMSVGRCFRADYLNRLQLNCIWFQFKPAPFPTIVNCRILQFVRHWKVQPWAIFSQYGVKYVNTLLYMQ